MTNAGRLLRRPGPPRALSPAEARLDIEDARLEPVLARDAPVVVLHEGAIHPEGPVWDPASRRLLFSDVPNRRLLAWHEADGRVTTVIDPTWFMNGNARAPDGTLYHCEHGRRCVSRSSPDGHAATPIVTTYDGRTLNSPNDVAIAPDGAVWFTDPVFGLVMPSQGWLDEPALDHRSVYRHDPATGALARMADFGQPNGLAFSPDGRVLYVSDSAAALAEAPGPSTPTMRPDPRFADLERDVTAFDVGEDGTLSRRRWVCRAEGGCPDGMTTDAAGRLYVATAAGIEMFAPCGEGGATRLGVLRLPTVATNVIIADGRLFVTAERMLVAIAMTA